MKAQELKGHLDLMLLAVIEDGPLHGYAVIEELRRRSDDALDLPEGTVYPALHRLERAGLLESTWVVTAGRRRRCYSLTTSGRGAVVERRRDWRAFTQTVEAVLGPGATSWPSPA